MTKNKTKAKKRDFSYFAKLSIGIGVLYWILIAIWATMQLLEALGKIDLSKDSQHWVQYVYYVLFTIISLATPSWIAILSLSYVKGIEEKPINSKQYKVHVIVVSTLIVVFLILGAVFSLVWADQPSEHRVHWSGYLSNIFLTLDLFAILYGIIISGIGLKYIKK